MLKGVHFKWIQPVIYLFEKGLQNTKRLLDSNSLLQYTNRTNNQGAIDTLIKETQKEFLRQDRQLYQNCTSLYNVPNLLKGICNNSLQHVITVTKDGQQNGKTYITLI